MPAVRGSFENCLLLPPVAFKGSAIIRRLLGWIRQLQLLLLLLLLIGAADGNKTAPAVCLRVRQSRSAKKSKVQIRFGLML